jgi:DNA-binding MarR family transcriptional regulator
LVELGYIRSDPPQSDKRQRELRLTEKGEEAMAGTSVLDGERIVALLERLNAAERKSAVDGLRLLARAARELEERK